MPHKAGREISPSAPDELCSPFDRDRYVPGPDRSCHNDTPRLRDDMLCRTKFDGISIDVRQDGIVKAVFGLNREDVPAKLERRIERTGPLVAHNPVHPETNATQFVRPRECVAKSHDPVVGLCRKGGLRRAGGTHRQRQDEHGADFHHRASGKEQQPRLFILSV